MSEKFAENYRLSAKMRNPPTDVKNFQNPPVKGEIRKPGTTN